METLTYGKYREAVSITVSPPLVAWARRRLIVSLVLSSGDTRLSLCLFLSIFTTSARPVSFPLLYAAIGPSSIACTSGHPVTNKRILFFFMYMMYLAHKK